MAKIDIKKKKKKKNQISNLFLYYQIIKIAYFCVNTEEKNTFKCISWKFYTKKMENT